jgi:hypothetical protein
MFVVPWELGNKPNMEFWMHKSGLDYHDLQNEDFTFVNTCSISRNKAGFTKRQI